jgi:PIN domain nuclease of toxin-antitoxin system
MKLLLDTHAFLFAINPVEQLPARIQTLIEDPQNERWVSTITLWEIAIKVQLKKLPLPSDQIFYTNHLRLLQANLMQVETRHVFTLFDLPLHHRDPFDRMLIAQAKAEGLTVITRDRIFAAYDVPVLW